MPDSIDKTLPSWSATGVFQTLQHTLGDRRHSSSAVEDAVWFHHAQHLLYSASLRPDVASRVLSCFLFLESGFTSLRTENPQTVSYLKKMCQHAKQVNEDYYANQSRLNHRDDVADSDDSSIPQRYDLPQDEVTFVATFMEPFLNGTIPPLQKSLECVLGSSPSDVDDSDDQKNMLQLLDHLLSRILQTQQSGEQFQMGEPVERSPSDADAPSKDSLRKLVLSTAQKEDTEGLDTTKHNAPSSSMQEQPLAEAMSQDPKDCFSTSHLSLIDVLFGPDSRDTHMLRTPEFNDADLRQWRSFNTHSGTLENTDDYLPFRTRTREEMRQQAAADEVHVNRMTVVVRDGGAIGAPEWEACREESDSKPQASRSSSPLPADQTLRENGNDQADKDGRRAEPSEGVSVLNRDDEKKQDSNTTWVKDGELVMIGGRLVVQPGGYPRKRQRREPKDIKNSNKDNKGAQKNESKKNINEGGMEISNDNFLPQSESKIAPNHPSQSHASRMSSDKGRDGELETEGSDSKSKSVRTEESNKIIKNVSSPEKRKRKNQNNTSKTSQSGSASSMRVVPTHNVPVLSREEVVKLVEGWQLSNTLREAFLVGLEPGEPSASSESAKTVLKLENSKTSE